MASPNLSITINADKYKKFLSEAPDKMGRIMQNVIYKTALLVERYAKIDAPVDTGRLRASISTSIYPMKATIEPHVNYAGFVHDGTRYMTGRPFMANAATSVDSQVPGIIENELKSLE